MNIATLKYRVLDNPENIKSILEALNIWKIKDFGKEYRGAIYENSNPTGICVKKENGAFYYRGSKGELSGDIFTLVQYIKDCKLNEAMVFVCKVLGIDYTDNSIEEVYFPFGGYYKEVKSYQDDILELPTYSEDVLDEYINIPSTRFQKDGISLATQKEFKVMYDIETHRIVFPWRNSMGEIIGVVGRTNDNEYKEKGLAKYFPLISFPKSQALFGFYENYDDIVRDKVIFVFESEKAVLQMRSMEKAICNDDGEIIGYKGINLAVSVGSHSISSVQKKLMLSTYPNTIIICFDEGLEEEYLNQIATQLKFQNSFYSVKVGYIYDRENKYLPKESKMSPSDLGLNIFTKLLHHCVVMV